MKLSCLLPTIYCFVWAALTTVSSATSEKLRERNLLLMPKNAFRMVCVRNGTAKLRSFIHTEQHEFREFLCKILTPLYCKCNSIKLVNLLILLPETDCEISHSTIKFMYD
jgi:hypothetical protein